MPGSGRVLKSHGTYHDKPELGTAVPFRQPVGFGAVLNALRRRSSKENFKRKEP